MKRFTKEHLETILFENFPNTTLVKDFNEPEAKAYWDKLSKVLHIKLNYLGLKASTDEAGLTIEANVDDINVLNMIFEALIMVLYNLVKNYSDEYKIWDSWREIQPNITSLPNGLYEAIQEGVVVTINPEGLADKGFVSNGINNKILLDFINLNNPRVVIVKVSNETVYMFD